MDIKRIDLLFNAASFIFQNACSEALDCLQRFSEFSPNQSSAAESKLIRRTVSHIQSTASQELELSAHSSPSRKS